MPGVGVGAGVWRPRRGAGGPLPPATDPIVTAINADGWSVAATSPPTMDPVGNPRFVVASRQGFNAAGAPTTHLESIILTQRVRQPFPNQASLDASRVAMSDYVYSTDTVVGVTNNSAETSPKPVANWALPDQRVVGNTLRLEVVAFHRNARAGEQVACVEFRATDGSTTVTQIVSASSILAHPGDVNPVVGYACDLDIMGLNSGAITANARVIPWIGGAASVLNSSDQSAAREFSPQTYLKNTALASSPVFAYVNPTTGNDTTGAVSTNAATAEATPCLTVTGAINRIIAVNGSVDGCVIRLMAGTHVLNSSAALATRTQNTGELIVTRDPNATRAAVIAQFGLTSTVRWRLGATAGWVRLRDITLSRQGTSNIQGETGSQLSIWFDQVTFQNNNHNAAFLSNSHSRFTGAAFTGMTASPLNASTTEHRLFRGISSTNVGVIESWLLLGSNLSGTTLVTGRGPRTQNGAIIAYNTFSSASPATGGFGNTENITAGAALVQNVIEFTGTVSGTAVRMAADAATGDTTHVIMHHNTLAGSFLHGRSNLFYNDSPPPSNRTNRLMSLVGNLHIQINTKHDVFAGLNDNYADAADRLGGWAYLYGVGCRGEFSQFIDAQSGGIGGSFAQAYPGLSASIGTSSTVRNDPLFVGFEATAIGGGAGAGGGNYRLQAGSPAASRVTERVLPFDLDGNARTGAQASGAYRLAA